MTTAITFLLLVSIVVTQCILIGCAIIVTSTLVNIQVDLLEYFKRKTNNGKKDA